MRQKIVDFIWSPGYEFSGAYKLSLHKTTFLPNHGRDCHPVLVTAGKIVQVRFHFLEVGFHNAVEHNKTPSRGNFGHHSESCANAVIFWKTSYCGLQTFFTPKLSIHPIFTL